jgi:lauroyl/myristoyl acyltransferase
VQALATIYELGGRLVRAVPAQVRYPVAVAGGAVWFKASRAQQRNALENYGAVLGLAPDDPRVRDLARQAFQGYGQTLADFVLLGKIGKEELLERLKYVGREHLDEAVARGKGAILVVPHMGSWDMAAAAAAALGYPISAIAEPFPGSLDRAVIASREGFGLRIIPLNRGAVRNVLATLGRGEVVALACDLPPERGGVDVRFFGRRFRVAGGPIAFARRTGAAVVPAACYRLRPGQYHVDIDVPVEVPREGPDREAQTVGMQRVIDRFETFIRKRPEQWYVFRPMFT